MRFSYLNIRNSHAALIITCLALLFYLVLWARCEWPAGGQDSWNHYLYSRWSLKHPELMLNQWAKPLFTIPAIPFSYLGIQGIYVFNILCILLSGWLVYATARILGMRLPWMAAAFFLFQPVVFGNVVSALTEPINALAVSAMCYLFVRNRNIAGTLLASLLPFFRSEGFILLGAVLVYLIARRKWKHIPLLAAGSAVYILITGIVLKNWSAILDENPYLKFEFKGEFNPGHGSFFHYAKHYQAITGLAVSALMISAFVLLAAHIVYLIRRKTPEEKSRFCFWLIAPLFVSFFLAHSFIWWKGSMGSHGLTRVFLVVAPAASLLALYALDKVLSFDFRYLNKFLPVALVLYLILLAYVGNTFPWPWSKNPAIPAYPAEINISKAFNYIREKGLENYPVAHQMPSISAQRGWDPWGGKETFELWSMNKNPEQDWLPDSTIVLWDGWHALRDTPMPLDTMRSLPHYTEIQRFTEVGVDTIYDVHLFIKTAD